MRRLNSVPPVEMRQSASKWPWLVECFFPLWAFVFLLGVGCASQPRAKSIPSPPSEEVRAQLGTIRFVGAGNLTNSLLQKPMSPSAATATGAGLGALWGLSAGAEVGGGGGELGVAVAVLVWCVAVPVGSLVGAATGNMEGMPVRERQRAEAKLHQAVLATDVQRLMNNEILRLIHEKTRESVVPLDAFAFARRGRSATGYVATNSVVDTILEVTVLNAGLSGGRARSAPLAAFLQVRVRLVRACDGVELYAHTWVPLSGSMPFEKWAADDGQAMRRELSEMIIPLADSVVEELFLVYDPKHPGK